MNNKLRYFTILIIFSPFVTFANIPSGESDLKSYLFDEIIIKGMTNVKAFQLSYSEDQFTKISSETKFGEINKNLMISIPAKNIKAESKLMLADFLKLINAKDYPEIHIKIDPKVTSKFQKRNRLEHGIQLTMNGITNNYTCSSEIENGKQEEKCLLGTLKVKLTDFNIEPPQKFFGIIKVEEEVFISFKILFSTV
ncbi:YceI family protein [Sunxiuqinia sp. A32]|uniref:YceI family protein n=1 Tax=Sunxiuqinia sp. A32 TaxID=3461496 RepID=UPI0040452294